MNPEKPSGVYFSRKKKYQGILNQKKHAAVKGSDAPAGAELLEAEEKIAFRERRKREIREAQSAGLNATSGSQYGKQRLKIW